MRTSREWSSTIPGQQRCTFLLCRFATSIPPLISIYDDAWHSHRVANLSIRFD